MSEDEAWKAAEKAYSEFRADLVFRLLKIIADSGLDLPGLDELYSDWAQVSSEFAASQQARIAQMRNLLNTGDEHATREVKPTGDERFLAAWKASPLWLKL